MIVVVVAIVNQVEIDSGQHRGSLKYETLLVQSQDWLSSPHSYMII